MLVSSTVGFVEELLQKFRPCFSKPQFRNFSTYILGLVTCEGKRKNVEARDQSTLNRFLTASPWFLQCLEDQRLALARENLPVPEGSTGYLIIDDTLNKKTGLHMEEA
jgi:hypothetical protein